MLWRRKTARALILDTEKGLYLVARSSLPPFGWHLPGGGIARGETPEQALRRELDEELGMRGDDIHGMRFIKAVRTSPLCIPHLEQLFLVTVPLGIVPRPNWEIAELRWIDADALRALLPHAVVAES